MAVARRVERVGQRRREPAGTPGTSNTVGPIASANVSRISTRPIGASMVIGWLKTMPVPNVESAVGVPNVAGEAAATTGTSPSSSPTATRHDGRSDSTHQSAHASPAIRTIPRPFWPAPSSPVRDSAQPGP